MINYIKGTLEERNVDHIIVDLQGIGYQLMVPGSVLSELPALGSTIKVYTYLQVRDDVMVLFGFLTKEDLSLFKLLITVNGIGPKGALGILSVLNGYQLKMAVAMGDVKAICQAPGVGKKTAQKLILDLKDKIAMPTLEETAGLDEKVQEQVVGSTMALEAIEALVALGYNSSEATRVIKNLGPSQSVEALIKEALKALL